MPAKRRQALGIVIHAAQQFIDGLDRDLARLAEAIVEKTMARRFAQHLARGRCQGDENAARGLLALHRADEVTHVANGDILAALHRDDHRRKISLGEARAHPANAIDATIGTLLLATLRHRINQRDRPPLELVLVPRRQIARTGQILRGALHVKDDGREGILHAPLDQRDGEMRDVDAHPAAPKLFGGMNGGAAAAEGVEHDVAWITGCGHDAFEKGKRLLCRIPQKLTGPVVDTRHIRPKILERDTLHFIEVTLVLWNGSAPGLYDASGSYKLFHVLTRKTPVPAHSHDFVEWVAIGITARTLDVVKAIAPTIGLYPPVVTVHV